MPVVALSIRCQRVPSALLNIAQLGSSAVTARQGLGTQALEFWYLRPNPASAVGLWASDSTCVLLSSLINGESNSSSLIKFLWELNQTLQIRHVQLCLQLVNA